VHEAAAAIVVAFQPDRALIIRLIQDLAREFRIVYVMDNGGGREALTESIGSSASIQVVDMAGNKGIGVALNRGFQLASLAGMRYVITFDQDSTPPAGLGGQLMQALERLMAGGVRIAAVGPRVIDIRQARQLEHPFMRRRMGWPTAATCISTSELIDADFLITSGCLIPLAAFEAVGPFDQELFVDFVDMEWCLRARAAGYMTFGVCSAVMPHEIGTATKASAFGMTVLGHNPVRRYFFARNTIRLLRLPHLAVGWKARLLISLLGRLLLLPIAVRFNTGWTKHWLMLGKGVVHGIANVGGPYVERP
jgi:rhamnosyltransferase